MMDGGFKMDDKGQIGSKILISAIPEKKNSGRDTGTK